ncbi:MAG: DNA polymerase III subunit delta [Nitrospira sp.]|nr:DNA polymerase III subunit delta [Nitrospira sp.]
MAALTPSQLEAALKQQTPAPLYLVVGEEDLLRDHALAVLKTVVLGDEGGFNYDLFYGDEASGADIRNCASELPAFAERRLVVVKAAEKLPAKETEMLIDYVNQPVETTTLVFMSQKLDGRLKFSQALARKAVLIDCSPLREPQLNAWIVQEAERLGLRLDEQARQALKDMGGGSLHGLRREMEKLAVYTSPTCSVTAADVQALRGIEPDASIFDLTRAIADGQRGLALSILARNLEAGEAPLRLLGSLAWQYRRIWKVKEVLASGGRDAEAARTLRMDPEKVRSFLSRFSFEHLQTVSRLLFEADGQLKGGSSGRPRIVLERLLFRLCELATTRPSGPTRTPPLTGRGTVRVVSNVRTVRSGSWTRR